jgi:DNA-binding IclR family transcriptional regulator
MALLRAISELVHDGLAVREIARRLRLPPSDVRRVLRRFFDALRP